MQLQPTRDQVKGLIKLPKDEKIVMVNLLKYHEKAGENRTGAEAYRDYSNAIRPLLEKAGGRVLWVGNTMAQVIGEEDQNWDAVAIVEYPGSRAFLKMSSSPEYDAIHHDREAALVKTVLLATHTEYLV